MTISVCYKCLQLPTCLQKFGKSWYDAHDVDRNPPSKPNLKKEYGIETLPVLLSETPAKRTSRSLRNKGL